MSSKSKTKATARTATSKDGRLHSGELDGLVLDYLRKHKQELPLTPSAVAKGIDRSSGAVANCLARLAKKKEARQAKRYLQGVSSASPSGEYAGYPRITVDYRQFSHSSGSSG